MARLMTSHVNIYFFRRPPQSSSLENIATMSISCLYYVRVEIFFLCCELSSYNAWCCREDANINSYRLRRRELILRNLPSTSNTMRYSTIIHSREKYFLSINSRRRSRSKVIFASARQHHALVEIIHSREKLCRF